MSGFHVERHLSDACSHNYKQTPLSSTRTNIHINLEVQKSTARVQAVCYRGAAHRGTMPAGCEVSCAERWVPLPRGLCSLGEAAQQTPSTRGRAHTSEHV